MTDTPKTAEELDEMRARVLCAADEDAPDGKAINYAFTTTYHRGDCTNEPMTCPVCYADEYRDKVRAIREADDAAGLKIVPAEATEAMSAAAHGSGGRGIQCKPLIDAAIAAGAIREDK